MHSFIYFKPAAQ